MVPLLSLLILQLFCPGFCTGPAPIQFVQPGVNASVDCLCEERRSGCYMQLLRWFRMDPSGSLTMIDTDCKKHPSNQCRFSSGRTSNTHVRLSILRVQPSDSGRYYCGEHLSSYISFTDSGSVLAVGGGSPGSRVRLMTGYRALGGEGAQGRPLRCVVSGLGETPWLKLSWGDRDAALGKVEHKWRGGTMKGGWLDYRVSAPPQNWSAESDGPCQAQTAWNHISNATELSLEREQEVWCSGQYSVLYAGLLAVLCVLAALALMVALYTGSKQNDQQTADRPGAQAVLEGVTYAQLDLQSRGETDRRRKQRQKDRKADSHTYSAVRYTNADTAWRERAALDTPWDPLNP
ncbi:uncharacterized protein LOC136767268 isoform X2 [Amia ocellicauda]|uniref:uncharacterized protein LOC136767268 isoform X2 n=1 Tax=Amia ocellicauda TaxID=2972642 RepID=UPI003464787D